jgi:large subunit ribosomal protein L18
MNKIQKMFVKRAARVRRAIKIHNKSNRPRLSIFISNKYIYAQLINDASGNTIVSASSLETKIKNNLKSKVSIDAAKVVGKKIGERALDLGVDKVVIDRGGKLFHGRIKALVEALREVGLNC